MNSASAVNGMTGIGAKESGWFRHTRQVGGPALGYWQVEPETHDDCWTNFLDSPTRSKLRETVLAMQRRAGTITASTWFQLPTYSKAALPPAAPQGAMVLCGNCGTGQGLVIVVSLGPSVWSVIQAPLLQ